MRFLDDFQIPWPNAYGANPTLAALGIENLPAVLLVERNGRIVWQGHDAEELIPVLEAHLAAPL